MLSDGIDIYGPGYTDCVLAVRTDLIKQNPAGAEGADQGDDEGAVHGRDQARGDAADPGRRLLQDLDGERADRHGRSSPRWSTRAARPSSSSTASNSIVEMGYIKKKPGRDAIDWTLLEQVIAENQDLYGKLKYKSAA